MYTSNFVYPVAQFDGFKDPLLPYFPPYAEISALNYDSEASSDTRVGNWPDPLTQFPVSTELVSSFGAGSIFAEVTSANFSSAASGRWYFHTYPAPFFYWPFKDVNPPKLSGLQVLPGGQMGRKFRLTVGACHASGYGDKFLYCREIFPHGQGKQAGFIARFEWQSNAAMPATTEPDKRLGEFDFPIFALCSATTAATTYNEMQDRYWSNHRDLSRLSFGYNFGEDNGNLINVTLNGGNGSASYSVNLPCLRPGFPCYLGWWFDCDTGETRIYCNGVKVHESVAVQGLSGLNFLKLGQFGDAILRPLSGSVDIELFGRYTSEANLLADMTPLRPSGFTVISGVSGSVLNSKLFGIRAGVGPLNSARSSGMLVNLSPAWIRVDAFNSSHPGEKPDSTLKFSTILKRLWGRFIYAGGIGDLTNSQAPYGEFTYAYNDPRELTMHWASDFTNPATSSLPTDIRYHYNNVFSQLQTDLGSAWSERVFEYQNEPKGSYHSFYTYLGGGGDTITYAYAVSSYAPSSYFPPFPSVSANSLMGPYHRYEMNWDWRDSQTRSGSSFAFYLGLPIPWDTFELRFYDSNTSTSNSANVTTLAQPGSSTLVRWEYCVGVNATGGPTTWARINTATTTGHVYNYASLPVPRIRSRMFWHNSSNNYSVWASSATSLVNSLYFDNRDRGRTNVTLQIGDLSTETATRYYTQTAFYLDIPLSGALPWVPCRLKTADPLLYTIRCYAVSGATAIATGGFWNVGCRTWNYAASAMRGILDTYGVSGIMSEPHGINDSNSRLGQRYDGHLSQHPYHTYNVGETLYHLFPDPSIFGCAIMGNAQDRWMHLSEWTVGNVDTGQSDYRYSDQALGTVIYYLLGMISRRVMSLCFHAYDADFFNDDAFSSKHGYGNPNPVFYLCKELFGFVKRYSAMNYVSGYHFPGLLSFSMKDSSGNQGLILVNRFDSEKYINFNSTEVSALIAAGNVYTARIGQYTLQPVVKDRSPSIEWGIPLTMATSGFGFYMNPYSLVFIDLKAKAQYAGRTLGSRPTT